MVRLANRYVSLMAATVINATDIFDFQQLPHPQQLVSSSPQAPPSFASIYHHPLVGSIAFHSTAFSYMHVMDMHWNTTNDIDLRGEAPTDTVNINFLTNGYLYSRFNALAHPLDMSSGKHNLIYTPEIGDSNQVKGKQSLSMFHISLDKTFFASAIGYDDSWSDKAQQALERQHPFSGITGTQHISAQMLSLIDSIRTSKAVGPMQNLLFQSRILELLALQIDQFKAPRIDQDTINPGEAEKLYQLKAYLDSHFLTTYTLTQLSRLVLLNEFKLKKGFKQLFGVTVFSYIRQLRMEYAGLLLRDCTMPVEEVSERLGYEHPQHFSIAFKKYSGVNPSHYQRNKVHY
ncbi:helix-turn-helix transcriptional regulator [Spirosoma terrae]